MPTHAYYVAHVSSTAPVVSSANDSSVWSFLPPAIVGAVIALLGSLFVQGWLVPRIEARKRREQRWETDLRDLGEALSSDRLLTAASGARWGVDWWVDIRNAEQPDDITPAHWERIREAAEEKANTTQAEYDDLATSRVRWLVSRVVALSPSSPELRGLQWQASRYTWASISTREWRFKPGVTVEEHHAAWDKENQARETLTKAVIALLDAKRLPRLTLRERFSRWWKRQRTRMSGWWSSLLDKHSAQQPPG